MVDRTDTFVREVDEELRREQIKKIWDTYGLYIVALVATVLASVLGYQYWQGRQVAASEAAGARFQAASRLAAEGKADEALAAFSGLAQDGSKGYQTLARFRVAGAQIKAGKPAEALAAYEAIARDAGVDPLLTEFAAVQAAMLRLDSADWTDMENRLTPLMGERSYWRAMARETLGLAAYKAGKTEEARKLFEQTLGDRTAPPSVSERALLMLSLLTDAEAAKSAVVEPAPAGDAAKKAADKATGKAGTPDAQKKK